MGQPLSFGLSLWDLLFLGRKMGPTGGQEAGMDGFVEGMLAAGAMVGLGFSW